MVEEWDWIDGYLGIYEVSTFGRVKSYHRFDRGGKVLKPGRSTAGYPTVTLHRGPEIKLRSVHSLVMETFVGPRPDKHEIRHLDGDYQNARLDNLRYGTRHENMMDAVRHGTHANASKTHCPQGHEYTPENTYSNPRFPRRSCRICGRAANQAAKARRKAELVSPANLRRLAAEAQARLAARTDATN